MTKYEPMLCKTGNDKLMVQVAQGNYFLEEKLDGIRCIAYCTAQGTTLINRSGVDVTKRFPEVKTPKQAVVLDGELCCYTQSGYTDFQLIQTRANRITDIANAAAKQPAVFVPFDMLEYNGMSILDHDNNRRSIATRNLAHDWGLHLPKLWASDVLTEPWLDAQCNNGLEGVIAKLRTSKYAPGMRSSHWLKFKGWRTQEYEVLGATYGTGKRDDWIGALLIGYSDETNRTFYVGKVGTGFSDQDLSYFNVMLANMAMRDLGSYNPWIGLSAGDLADAKYIIPSQKVYIKVKYQELTSHGTPRFPVYVGINRNKGVFSV